MTQQEIADDIIKYINNSNVPYGQWYIGIASDYRARLFNDHNVSEKGGMWIYRQASSEQDARHVEAWLIDKLKTQGDSGGGDSSTRYVYAYRITTDTIE